MAISCTFLRLDLKETLDYLPRLTESLTWAAFFMLRDRATYSFVLINQVCSIEGVQRIMCRMKIDPGCRNDAD